MNNVNDENSINKIKSIRKIGLIRKESPLSSQPEGLETVAPFSMHSSQGANVSMSTR